MKAAKASGKNREVKHGGGKVIHAHHKKDFTIKVAQ